MQVSWLARKTQGKLQAPNLKNYKTNFLIKSQNIKSQDVSKKVTIILESNANKSKEKQNVKNIIGADIKKQKKNIINK